MADNPIFLDNTDVKVLRELVTWYCKRVERNVRDVEEETFQTPDVYIAYTEGIDALEIAGTGTGTGIPDEVTPGSAECSVCRVISGMIIDAGFKKQTVYNLSESAVAAGFVAIKRDKYGSWVVDNAATGGDGCGIPGIDFNDLLITGGDDNTGTGTTAALDDPPEYILGIRDGCLVKVPVSSCDG